MEFLSLLMHESRRFISCKKFGDNTNIRLGMRLIFCFWNKILLIFVANHCVTDLSAGFIIIPIENFLKNVWNISFYSIKRFWQSFYFTNCYIIFVGVSVKSLQGHFNVFQGCLWNYYFIDFILLDFSRTFLFWTEEKKFALLWVGSFFSIYFDVLNSKLPLKKSILSKLSTWRWKWKFWVRESKSSVTKSNFHPV